MSISKKQLYREIIDYVMIAVGMVSYAIGWSIFLLPNNIGNGGVAGLASIIYWGTGTPITVTYFGMNVILLAIALKVLGWRFCVRTVYGVITLTVAVGVMRTAFPNPMILHSQPFMVTIIGGIFCGLGVGFGLAYNGSSGGSDIVAAVVNKYRDISLGRVILLCDIIIVSLSYFVLHSWEQVIYGYVTLFTISFVVDQVVNVGRQSVQFLIISERYEEICEAIIGGTHPRGCTLLDAQGYYTGHETKIILTVARKREAPMLYRLIDEIDPNAFITLNRVSGVYGNGFDRLKVKRKKQGARMQGLAAPIAKEENLMEV
ncbi:hypothetical protein HMPREF3218_0201463 [Prevotella bivia]|nr:hypothetical protein HMPREF3218_0201463 [Prevotella bivia]